MSLFAEWDRAYGEVGTLWAAYIAWSTACSRRYGLPPSELRILLNRNHALFEAQ